MVALLQRLWRARRCVAVGHEWRLLHREGGDWLDGATYTWVCDRDGCTKRLTSKPGEF